KGKLDVVFANAGAAQPAPFGKISEEHYDAVFDINVKGLLFTVQKALALMPDGASIILNASIVASKGSPELSVYSASKAAVRSFARTWTMDLKDRRIRVNAVSPDFIDTPGLSNLLSSSGADLERQKMISNAVPFGRFGTPEEIAKAVVFLASDDSGYATGTELFVDGGFAQVEAANVEARGEARLSSVSKAVQDALMSVLRIPPDDFYQIIYVLPRNRFLHTPSFLGMSYSDDLILLDITFISGRPKETRLALLKALNDGIVAAAGISPDGLLVTFYEVPGENISFGRGMAQRAHISDKAELAV